MKNNMIWMYQMLVGVSMLRSAMWVLAVLVPVVSQGQIQAFQEVKGDDQCVTILLYNPSKDTVYYIDQQKPAVEGGCQSYEMVRDSVQGRVLVYLSGKEPAGGRFELMLPRDTIRYRLLMPRSYQGLGKQVQFCARTSGVVIDINEEKKRNKKIRKLPGRMHLIEVQQ